MPFYLMQVLGYPASRAGLMVVPSSICMAIVGPISGRLSDRVGTRWLAVGGMALTAAAMFTFSRLTVDSSPALVIFGMVLSGSGSGIFSSTNTSAVMSSLGREKYGIVSALLSVTRTSANVTGVAIATTIIAVAMGSLGYEPTLAGVGNGGGEGVRLAFMTGLRWAYLLAVALVLAAMTLSALRGESRADSALLQSE
jgi:MFS family permease